MSQKNLSTILNYETLMLKRSNQLKPLHHANQTMVEKNFQEHQSISSTLHRTVGNSPKHREQQSQSIISLGDAKLFEKRIQSLIQLERQLQKILDEGSFNKESELFKVQTAITRVIEGLETASKSEVELGIKKREIEKMRTEMIESQQKCNIFKSRTDELEIMKERLESRIQDLEKQHKQGQHNLLLEQRANGELQHKIQCLEERLELVLESDFVGQSKEQGLRKTLTELVKECETYKRDLQNKTKEIDRLTEQLKTAQQRIAKINQKVELMKKKISLRDLESLNSEEKQIKITVQDVKNDPTAIMSKNELYETLDFRINSLRSEYSDIIHDIQEQGSSVFAQKVIAMTNPKCKIQIHSPQNQNQNNGNIFL